MTSPKMFIEQFNTSQTVAGLDFGDKTIGIAISDKTHIVATPIMTLQRKGIEKDIAELIKIFNEYNVKGIVFGLPLSLNGNENDRTKKVRFFAKEIELLKKLKIAFHDERYSTDVIYKELRKNTLSRTKIKKKINHLAASYILQGFLNLANFER